MHNVLVLMLGIMMVSQFADSSVVPLITGCPSLLASELEGGKNLAAGKDDLPFKIDIDSLCDFLPTDQFICTDQLNIGSICWLTCDGLQERMNPVDPGELSILFFLCIN